MNLFHQACDFIRRITKALKPGYVSAMGAYKEKIYTLLAVLGVCNS
jgi:hypothetical protein